ncbi:homeodomain-interacting protein kinase 1-like isoform X2 [Notolabrus celidotus]|uniref:homeodomain-interacting protein kinase 1-like isoform X2 n=1 Tax=Notolabrus celidotus TaxID=1203425 RepID=UPI00148F8508|nr:homeodomain-interacting protein kinase 1-like isoform X2 [Notolabrus celidotus]
MTTVTVTEPDIKAGQTLCGGQAEYSVLEFIGEGCFGQVARCQNLQTKEVVAIKILKKDPGLILDTEKEVTILKVLSVLNPDATNLVKFFEQFTHMGRTCLAFEMLQMNLYDLLSNHDWESMFLNEIRPMAKQLFVALDALKTLGILHTDIKPDNILVINELDQALRIKLIDFGEAIPASKVQPGMEIQPLGYRAPEVALGLEITEAIDVWGVGCVLAYLFLAENLFPVNCDYQMMRCMVEVLGQPEDHQLRAGRYTCFFFTEEEAAGAPKWRLLTPEEYAAVNGFKAEDRHSCIDLPSSLDALVNFYPDEGPAETEDRRAFVDLMKGLLHLDGSQRITPHQALQHPFIKMAHLTQHPDYLNNSQVLMMSICQDPGSCCADMTPLSPEDGPTTGSPNRAAATDPRHEASDSWHSAGDPPPLWAAEGSSDGDTESQLLEGETPCPLYWDYEESWSFNGEKTSSHRDTESQLLEGETPCPLYWDYEDSGFSNGEKNSSHRDTESQLLVRETPCHLYWDYEDSGFSNGEKNSSHRDTESQLLEEETPCHLCWDYEDSWSSNRAQFKESQAEEPEPSSPEEEPPLSSDSEKPGGEATLTDPPAETTAPSGGKKKRPKWFSRVCRRIAAFVDRARTRIRSL